MAHLAETIKDIMQPYSKNYKKSSNVLVLYCSLTLKMDVSKRRLSISAIMMVNKTSQDHNITYDEHLNILSYMRIQKWDSDMETSAMIYMFYIWSDPRFNLNVQNRNGTS